MSLLKYLIGSILIIGIYYVVFIVFGEKINPSFGYNSEEVNKIFAASIRPAILALFTFIGIFSKFVFDEVKKADNKKFSIKEVFRATLNSKNSWLAIIVSPVIMIGFYGAINLIDSLPLVALLSYENGFFFNSILSKADEI